MAKIVEALWDCPYCGNKGIGGRTKHCPSCNHPQDEDTEFYLPNEKKYLDDETASKYGKGADWVCAYCGAMNRYYAENCVNCGAPREDGKGDYFAVQEKNAKEQAARAAEEQAAHAPRQRRSRLPLLAILLGLLALIVFFAVPRQKDATVSQQYWTRSIALEEYVTQQDADWFVPDGARVYEQKQEIRSYAQVLDHYETVPVKHSREVIDHYETQISYSNNGDGTYTEHSNSVPVYTTEYYTVMEDRPVYRNEPVYGTRYYFEIDRWVQGRTINTEGRDKAAYWGDCTLAENERERCRSASYFVTISLPKGKSYTAELSEELWNTLKVGDSVNITLTGGKLTAINNQPVS